jgi:hypothetical protein
MNVYTILSDIANGLVSGLTTLFNTIILGILSSVQSILTGFGLMIKNPLQTWAYDVANGSNQLAIPLIFTVILGISIFVLLFFIDIFGIEKDIDEGIGGLMEL